MAPRQIDQYNTVALDFIEHRVLYEAADTSAGLNRSVRDGTGWTPTITHNYMTESYYKIPCTQCLSDVRKFSDCVQSVAEQRVAAAIEDLWAK